MSDDLTVWKTIPAGFRLELSFDERGCLVTNRIGLSRTEQRRISADSWGWHSIRQWTEQMGQELIDALRKRFPVDDYGHLDFIVMSDQQQMDTLEVWVKTRKPVPSVVRAAILHHSQSELNQPPKQLPPGVLDI